MLQLSELFNCSLNRLKKLEIVSLQKLQISKVQNVIRILNIVGIVQIKFEIKSDESIKTHFLLKIFKAL